MRPFLALGFLVTTFPTLAAQDVLHEFSGTQLADDFVHTTALHDVDGDGFDDFAIGAPGANGRDGAVWIHSGATGAVIRTLAPPIAREYFGLSLCSAGDLDGDGIDELVVGALAAAHGNHHGALYVISGATGTTLRVIDGPTTDLSLGWSVAPAGDVDGDGIGDLGATLVGSSRQATQVYSGATGAMLLDVSSFGAFSAFRDVDGDGADDLLVGDVLGPNGDSAGIVRCHSGRSGAVLFQVEGAAPDERLGGALIAEQDFDGDGVLDILVGASGATGGAPKSGVVRAFSGATRALLFQHDGQNENGSFGGKVVAVGDVNGDDAIDYVIQGFSSGDTRPSLYSGLTARLLYTFDPIDPFHEEESFFAAAGDGNGDGKGDLLRGVMHYDRFSYEHQRLDPGTVLVHSGNDLWFQGDFSSGRPGETVTLHTRGGPANRLSAVALVEIDGAPTFRLVGTIRRLDSHGERTDTLVLPPWREPGPATHRIRLQAFALEPGGGVIDSAGWEFFLHK